MSKVTKEILAFFPIVYLTLLVLAVLEKIFGEPTDGKSATAMLRHIHRFMRAVWSFCLDVLGVMALLLLVLRVSFEEGEIRQRMRATSDALAMFVRAPIIFVRNCSQWLKWLFGFIPEQEVSHEQPQDPYTVVSLQSYNPAGFETARAQHIADEPVPLDVLDNPPILKKSGDPHEP